MKAVCVVIPLSPTGAIVSSSPWLTLGEEYTVISVVARSGAGFDFHVLTDDRENLGWFDASNFCITEGDIPKSWTIRIHDDVLLEIGPAAWMVDGFWEAYYDREDWAVESVFRELALMGRLHP